MGKKYRSPARKIYYYHILGISITDINRIYNIYSISAELNKYGLPADGGKNIGKLEFFSQHHIDENTIIESIRNWIDSTASGSSFSGTDLGFESLAIYLRSNLLTDSNSLNNFELTLDNSQEELDSDDTNEVNESGKDETIHSKDLISTIRIENFKKLKLVNVDLSSKINCIVGPNNSGKSSFLQAIHFSASILNSSSFHLNPSHIRLYEESIKYTPPGTFFDLKNKGINSADSENYEEPRFRFKFGYKSGDQIELECDFEWESVSVSLHPNYHSVLKNNFIENNLSTVFVPGISGIPELEFLKVRPEIDELAAKGDSNSVLSNILYIASLMGDEWLKLIEQLNKIYDRKYSIKINTEKLDNKYLLRTLLEYSENDVEEKTSVPLNSTGTGFLQILQILAYIFVYKPNILILDEPDSHLHPDLQKKLIDAVSELAEDRNFQILIATHSTYILDAVEESGGNVYEFGTIDENGGQLVQDYDKFRVLMDLGALDIYHRINNRDLDFIILTEDTASKWAGPYRPAKKRDFLKTIISSSLGDKSAKYEILSYRGCSNYDVVSAISETIYKISNGAKIIIHRDRDFIPDNKIDEFIGMCRNVDAIPFITKYSDLEFYFARAEHLNLIIPNFDNEMYQNLIVQLKNQDSFKRNMINKIKNDHKIEFNQAEVLYLDNPDGFMRGKEFFSLAAEFTGIRPTEIVKVSKEISDDKLKNILNKILEG